MEINAYRTASRPKRQSKVPLRTYLRRFFDLLFSWATTALLLGGIWGFAYLLYQLLQKELSRN